MKKFYFDSDFRRSPKTDTFCCVCMRDIMKPKFFVWLGDPSDHVVHPHELTGIELKSPIGSECSRKIPSEFFDENIRYD